MEAHLLGVASACLFSIGLVSAVHAAPISGQGTWETTLQGRNLDGDAATFEAYYDTVLDITWLADANAAGIAKTWDDAMAWSAGLNINGITGWRLPTLGPIDGATFDTTKLTTNATTDIGSARTTTDTEGSDGGWRDRSGTPVSEMGHMYYVSLANLSFCDPNEFWCSSQDGWGLENTGPFTNIQSDFYWLDTEFSDTEAWYFGADDGVQVNNIPKHPQRFAWAVRPGDVGPVPLPAAVWLFGGGLLGLLGMVRRKR